MSSKQFPVSRMLLVLFFVAVVTLTIYGFISRTWLPPVASEHGQGVDSVINYLLATTGMVFVIGHIVLGWLVWKHTGLAGGNYKPVSSKVEWLWAIVPVVFMAVVSEAGVLVMGHPVWEQLYGDLPDDAIPVEVIGKQFEWFVRYPGKDGKFGRTDPHKVREPGNPLGLVQEDPHAVDDIITRGALWLPVGRPVSVILRSHDVQHSFTIPAFRVKQDLMPGMSTHTQFVTTKVSTQEEPFEIGCAKLCGLGHYKMRGIAIVRPQKEFDEWLAKQIGWFE